MRGSLSSLRIIVTGLMAQHPRLAGMTWHYLQYLLGLERLGHDVYYIEDSGEIPYRLDGGDDWETHDCAANVGHLIDVMSRFGLGERWAYRYAPLRHDGRVLGQKDVEFRRFVELPEQVAPVPMEVALGPMQHTNWQANGQTATPRELLTRLGWRVADADEKCRDLDGYRQYIRSSRAEWSVAKNAYVQGRPAWFSERSACYLAAGRPVVVQDTGFSEVLPVGEGILSFETPDEAAEAIREVDGHHARHAAAAVGIAEAYFDSDKVLTRLVAEAMEVESVRSEERPSREAT